MIKAIIFDYFGVIRPDGFNAWLKMHDLKHEGRILEITQRHDRGEITEAEMFIALGKESEQDADAVEAEMESNVTPDQNVVKYIQSLRSVYKIALLSNSASEYLRAELKKNNLEKEFDEVIISSEVGYIKPEPEIFKIVLDRLSITESECVFVDDNSKHVVAAKAQGIKGIVYTGLDDLRRFVKNLP